MKVSTKSRWLALLVICTALLALPVAPVIAHEDAARTEELSAGPYQLSVQLYDDPVQVGQPLEVTVRSLPGGPDLEDATVTVTGVPGLGTDATQTREIAMQPETAEPGSYAGEVSFPVRGAWDVRIRVSGPAGEGTASLPVTVAVPGAIPVWLGWLVGLSPLVGIAWFAWWNRGYLHQLRAEEVDAT
ncbi:MAG: FixH family protein [Actinomycetota bacterium]|nr:FixH family protein [Actinomycetota bacterium]